MQSSIFEALMGQVLIRNIDDDVLERLKRRAAAQQKSFEQFLRDMLADAAKPSREELIVDLERLRTKIAVREKPGSQYPSAEEIIRQDRDSR